MQNICVVTGTRAEYGLWLPVLNRLRNHPRFRLQILVTGMHLSTEFGLTYRDILADGFAIDEKVEMLLSSDTPTAVSKAMGLATIGFADAFARLKPDLVLLLGDRFEILAAAQTALVANLPIAHLFGGDTTEGAFDEAIRHSITKMSHLHFVSNEESARRVRQMGENPAHVYTVGSTGIDNILNIAPLSRQELAESLGFSFGEKNILVTFHPVTLSFEESEEQFAELLTAIDRLDPSIHILFTHPNADTGGRRLIQMVEEFAATRPQVGAFASLGQKRYLSALRVVDLVLGNSSSGLYEAPSFKIPTIDIGDRQKGRIRANSVFHCEPTAADIENAIRTALQADCSQAVNPFGDGRSGEKILAILESFADFKTLIHKSFHNI